MYCGIFRIFPFLNILASNRIMTAGSFYEVILERIETAFGEDDKVFSFDSLRVKKFNRTTHILSGAYTMKQDLGKDIDIYAAGWNLQGGQYKLIIDKTLKNFCEFVYMDNHRQVFERYQKSTSGPVAWKTCPYPKGSNTVNEYLVEDSSGFIPPYIPGGERWKVVVMFSRKGKELGGYILYGIIRSTNDLLLG